MTSTQTEATMTEKKATILVVDDAPENLTLLGELLQGQYKVRTANSGARALHHLSKDALPDLILLDIMMPDMNGYEVIQKIKQDPISRDIPVIFVTALGEEENEQQGLDLGAVDYISKPIKASILLARIKTHLELKQARDTLRDQNAYLEAEVARRNRLRELILMSAGEGIYGIDTAGTITFINPSAAAMMGYPPEELLGKLAHDVFHNLRPDGSPYPVDDCPVVGCSRNGLGVRNAQEVFIRRDGSLLEVELSAQSMIEDGRHLGAVVTFRDISERKRYLAEIERKSNYDDLTGLINRNLLTDRLAQSMTRCRETGQQMALLLLNLDRFKSINESLGRTAGDSVLQEVAKRLTAVAPPGMTVARTENDEFVVVAEIDDPDEVPRLAQPILKALAEPYTLDQRQFFLSASVGVAMFPRDGEQGETLLQNAIAALGRVKISGGNNFAFYTAEMNARALERLDLENGLRRAIDNGELILHYQPQLSLKTGAIIGAEALVRWNHPEFGLLSPARFIPLAEESGLIVPLGEWVLRTACAQNRAWQQAGLPPISVAINLSARQVAAQDVVHLATEVLKETGLEAKYLEIELTESMVMADAEAFIHATERLKGLSITLSIDDFGTGFSSLSYLKRFSIDRLKIDQSFVSDLTQDPNSAAIAVAIISLSHSLGLLVIAEGVETEAQLNFLCARDCDEMQGFHFSRPIPAHEFTELLASGRKLALPSTAQGPRRTILLVDDEPSILTALNRLLRRQGYNILTAPGGPEGLELLAQHEVGVVISDARMPVMTGAEFLGRVRDIHPDTVRIMLSGYTDLEAVTSAVNRGELFRFLTKPWDDADLLATVQEAFRTFENRRAHHAATGT